MSSGWIIGTFVMLSFAIGLRRLLKASARPVRVVKWRKVPKGIDYVLTVEWSNGTVEEYRGSCTVWRVFPTGARCSGSMESWLSDRIKPIQWAEEDGV